MQRLKAARRQEYVGCDAYLQLIDDHGVVNRLGNVIYVHTCVLSAHHNIVRVCDISFRTEGGTNLASCTRHLNRGNKLQLSSLQQNNSPIMLAVFLRTRRQHKTQNG